MNLLSEKAFKNLHFSNIIHFRTKISPSVQNESLKTLDPSFKGAVFTYVGDALFWNKQSVMNYTLKLCKQRFLLNQRVFYFPKDFYLIQEINYQISALSANGILNNIISKYVDYAFLNVKSVDFELQAISLEQISGIFYVGSVCLTISISVFFGEMFTRNLKSRKSFEFLE
jgi:hypothetical protein